jgi:hypothetical protein
MIRYVIKYVELHCTLATDCVKFGQGPLIIFSGDRKLAQALQGSLVPWLISRFGVTYKRDGSPDIVRNMIAALIARDDIGGLGREIDLLKDRHVKAFDAIAKKAWSTAIRGINQHRHKFREFALQIFGTRKPTDVVANAVVERVFGKKTLGPLLDLQSATLNHLAVDAPIPALACIWESADSSKLGGHSILQNGNKLDTAGVESLFDFLGECLHTLLIP